ncbi:hypothetical protein JX265_011207 [Neoarthrinium moseri]|uniref:Glycoside hydrolase family 93 protein n=1 Tax=Neoarthrinium moseri TaxID=1658444 RepID=A0A9Q0AJV7_9PEZI|nr:uncharacterized protein JN550_010512 [Neoarthrinium moseri]KAI1845897.1 hypothetical protein JX266_007984 [Neoarthrinium moseri]KAI1857472.1 hypothetical protein JX265_011207 [Neoarthrinium moseri]KAI1862047.1 hypothetical protein JN550_010512 [Neoarthrinium moseri]
MFINTIIQAALLLLSCLPFLASSRSIPNPLAQRGLELSPRAVQVQAVKVEATPASDNHYSRVTRLSDGSILLAYTHFNDKERTIQVLKSTNNGASFQPWGEIAHRTSGDMDNVFLQEVGSTSPPTVLAAFRNHDKTDDNKAYTHFRITVCRSEDGGKNWKFLSQAHEFPAQPNADGFAPGIWEPFMRIGADGNIQMTFSKELAKDDQQTFRTTSKDGSRWSPAVNLKVHKDDVKLRDGMQGIVKVKDQKDGRDALVMVFETTRRGEHVFSVEYAVSYDDGATYPERGLVYAPAGDKKNAGSPQIVNLGDKGLAVLFMTDESTPTQDWPAIAQIKGLTSAGLKGGKIAWGTRPEVVGNANSQWPGLLSFNGKILGVFDNDGVVQGRFLSW